MYMESVLQLNEKAMEEEEERRFERLLDKLNLDEQLLLMSQEGEEGEKEHVERQEKRNRAQQGAHLASDVTQEAELDRMARRSEEEARTLEEADPSSRADSQVVLKMLLDEAKARHDEFKAELRDRHLVFLETLRQKAVDLHLEAEVKRKAEWAAGDKKLPASAEMLRRLPACAHPRP